jgi:hypothetical protein
MAASPSFINEKSSDMFTGSFPVELDSLAVDSVGEDGCSSLVSDGVVALMVVLCFVVFAALSLL